MPDLARTISTSLDAKQLARLNHDPFDVLFDAVRGQVGGDLTPDCYHPLWGELAESITDQITP